MSDFELPQHLGFTDIYRSLHAFRCGAVPNDTSASFIYVHAGNGDLGPAAQALLSDPYSVTVNRDGNLYIADRLRNREVNASGIIRTVAGNGTAGYSGDGLLAVDAQITHAFGIAFDNDGNLYFSQFYGNGDVIRKVNSSGFISTVAGNGQPGL